MNITYIGHSGFSVELDTCTLLFDYFEGTVPKFSKDKPLYVFSSHFHQDHFNMKIFELQKQYDSVTFILSYDIGRKFNEKFFLRHNISQEMYDQFIFIPERVTQTIDCLQIQTFHSTDEGVAFLVSADGKHIYHAGDLQWWTWPGETNDEYQQMTSAFQNEVARIPAISIDIAFLVLDPRQEENFWMGFDYFMRHTNTKMAYPMHFWKDVSVIDKLLSMDTSKDYRSRIMNKEFYN